MSDYELDDDSQKKLATPTKAARHTPAIVDSETVELLPLNDGSEYAVNKTQVAEWKRLFLSVDVEQAIRSMRAWLFANKAKRKTRRGIERFIVSWLAREQDKPRGNNYETRQRIDNSAPARIERAIAERKARHSAIRGKADAIDG